MIRYAYLAIDIAQFPFPIPVPRCEKGHFTLHCCQSSYSVLHMAPGICMKGSWLWLWLAVRSSFCCVTSIERSILSSAIFRSLCCWASSLRLAHPSCSDGVPSRAVSAAFRCSLNSRSTLSRTFSLSSNRLKTASGDGGRSRATAPCLARASCASRARPPVMHV